MLVSSPVPNYEALCLQSRTLCPWPGVTTSVRDPLHPWPCALQALSPDFLSSRSRGPTRSQRRGPVCLKLLYGLQGKSALDGRLLLRGEELVLGLECLRTGGGRASCSRRGFLHPLSSAFCLFPDTERRGSRSSGWTTRMLLASSPARLQVRQAWWPGPSSDCSWEGREPHFLG